MPSDPLTDEQREIRDLVRTLTREHVAPRAAEIDKKGEFPWDMVELFKEHELFGLPYDEEYGGGGQPYEVYLQVVEELASYWFTAALSVAVHSLTCFPLAWYGTEAQDGQAGIEHRLIQPGGQQGNSDLHHTPAYRGSVRHAQHLRVGRLRPPVLQVKVVHRRRRERID